MNKTKDIPWSSNYNMIEVNPNDIPKLMELIFKDKIYLGGGIGENIKHIEFSSEFRFRFGIPLSLSTGSGVQYGRYSECVLPNLIGYRPVLGGCDCPSRQRVACQKSIQITRIFGMASAATIRMMSQVVNLKAQPGGIDYLLLFLVKHQKNRKARREALECPHQRLVAQPRFAHLRSFHVSCHNNVR